MKKIMLLFSAALYAAGSLAQVANTSMVRINEPSVDRTSSKGLKAQFMEARRETISSRTANKGSGSFRRTYNYVDYLAKANNDILTDLRYLSLPYMWFRPDVFGVYSEGANLVAETIHLSSYGFVLHPTWEGYADINAYNPGTLVVTDNNNYMLDSVRIYGVYGRNPASTSTVDTLRVGFTYGNGGATNIGLGYYTGMAGRYSSDTVETAILNFDQMEHTLAKPISGTGPAIIYKDVYLTSSDTARTSFAVPAGLNVPVGNNLIAVTVTFKSGESYIPHHDTAFVGNLNPAAPFRLGMFRPFVFVENTGSFPTYIPGSYNAGQFKMLPDQAVEYGPTWGWYSNLKTGGIGPSPYQFPYIDFVISCSNCKSVSVPTNLPLAMEPVYPNPARDEINIPLKIHQGGKAHIEVSDLLGRVLYRKELGVRVAGESLIATFNTTSLINGIYLVTAHTVGARSTNRVIINK